MFAFRKKSTFLLKRVAAACIFFLALYWVVLQTAPFPYKALQRIQYSTCLFDKDENLIRVFTNKDGLLLMPIDLKEISPHLINATLSIEDKRFKQHFGVDILALIRAFHLNFKNGKILSGASTISMQVIRIIENRKCSLLNKIIEAVHAVKLETLYSKEEILRIYFEIAPYGGNIHGVKAASLKYFNKHPSSLTLEESALLAGIPQSPTRLRPDQYSAKAQKRRDKVLESMRYNSYIASKDFDAAIKEPVLVENRALPFKAPHFATFVKNRYAASASVVTTLDSNIQQFAEAALQETIKRMVPYYVTNGAIVVIENSTGKIRAMVGSRDFFSKEYSGQTNGALSSRCPGSTLKPFTYALGFDRGLYTPKMLLSDMPIQYAGYAPLDYDKQFRGPVTVRDSLANSLNIPALEVLDKLGQRNLYHFLKDAGITTLKKLPDHYGLALTLGSGDVNLLELTNAYAALARLGEYKRYSFIENETTSTKRILSDGAAYLIADILSDTARLQEAGTHRNSQTHPKLACKTGTSYGNKDAWTVCYNPEYTVGVWLGNFSGKQARALVGIHSAAPLAIKIFDWLYLKKQASWYDTPAAIDTRKVCALSGEPVHHSCKHSTTDLYIKHRSPNKTCALHAKVDINSDEKTINLERDKPKIISPLHNAEYFISHTDDARVLSFKAAGPANADKFYWFIDDKFYSGSKNGDKILWAMQAGKHKITCSDSLGRSSSGLLCKMGG